LESVCFERFKAGTPLFQSAAGKNCDVNEKNDETEKTNGGQHGRAYAYA